MPNDPPLWIKLPLRWRHHRNLKKISEARRWRFMSLYMFAGELDQKGAFIDSAGRKIPVEDIAIEIDCKLSELKRDLDVFKRAGLISFNGHGPMINDFFDDQGRKTMEERRAERRERNKKYDSQRRRDGDASPTQQRRAGDNAPTAPERRGESESESESESEEMKESVYQSSLYSREMTTDDERALKEQIVKASGIHTKYAQSVIDTTTIHPDDIMAGLAWAYANPKVNVPQAIAPKNLLNGELPPPEWYEPERIAFNLPRRLIEVAAPHLIELLSSQNSLYHNGYPKDVEDDIVMPAPCVEDRFLDTVKQQLEIEMPRSSFNRYVRDMVAVEFKDNVLDIACRDVASSDWAESHLKSTIQRLLVGVMPGDVTVRFIVEP